MGSTMRRTPGATSMARTLSGCGLGGRFVWPCRLRTLPLLLGRKREVDGVVGDHLQEDIDYLGIEVGSSAGPQLLERLLQPQRGPVDAVGDHGLEGIGDGD